MLEPHGAVGWAGLETLPRRAPGVGAPTAISLETAHPAKFPDEVRALTGVEPPLPPALAGLDDRPERFGEIPTDYAAFKAHLTTGVPRMKSVIILGDGMSDEPLPGLGGRTPLMMATKPSIDRIAREGRMGRLAPSPTAWPRVGRGQPGRARLRRREAPDGRAVLEAASMGVDLAPDDVALRCNLISTSDGRIRDHSAGHITTEEAARHRPRLDAAFGGRKGPLPVSFHPGVSYRHLLVLHGGWADPALDCAPPHDHLGEAVPDLLPRATSPRGRSRPRACASS